MSSSFHLKAEASSSAEFRLKAEATGIVGVGALTLPISVVSAFRRKSSRAVVSALTLPVSVASAFRRKSSGAVVSALTPVVTLKKRLPTPSARLQSSVISQPIVCGPLLSVDQSKMKWPPAAVALEKFGKAPAISARAAP